MRFDTLEAQGAETSQGRNAEGLHNAYTPLDFRKCMYSWYIKRGRHFT